MKKNTGKFLEQLITTIGNAYEAHRILKLAKVDPPSFVVRKESRYQAFFKRNPFVDYIGSWSKRGGRTLAIEAKSTSKPTLALCCEGGLRENQYINLHAWQNSGAAVGVLWEYDKTIKFLSLNKIMTILDTGKKSISFDLADEVKQGQGYILYDFEKNLEATYY